MSIERHEDGFLHAFVFIDHTTDPIAAILNNLAGLRSGSPRVRWAGSVVGDYLAFAHVEADDRNDLAPLQDFIEVDLRNAGARCSWATEIAVVNKKGTKHGTPEILALMGIKTQHGRTWDVLRQLESLDENEEIEGLKGASFVTGALDIVLQLNATTFVAAQDLLLQSALTGIDGIAWTSTAIGDGSRGPFGKS